MVLTPKDIINRTCIEKVSFTIEGANRAVDAFAISGDILYFYKCNFCNSYHMSSQDHSVNKLEVIGGKSNENNTENRKFYY